MKQLTCSRRYRNQARPPPPPNPEAFGTALKSFCTPTNYIYFDLIVSYLIILTTKFVKLPILWSQISPCRPRKQILLNFFLGLSRRYHKAPAKASSSTPPPPPRYLSTPPRTKIRKSVSDRNEMTLKGILTQLIPYISTACMQHVCMQLFISPPNFEFGYRFFAL
jgi:hypothetical protein